jgi:hypothetical protein
MTALEEALLAIVLAALGSTEGQSLEDRAVAIVKSILAKMGPVGGTLSPGENARADEVDLTIDNALSQAASDELFARLARSTPVPIDPRTMPTDRPPPGADDAVPVGPLPPDAPTPKDGTRKS